MWTSFILASAVTVLLLYLPGYLFWRAFRFSRIAATCTAPVASLAGLGIFGIAFERMGLPAHAATMAAALLGFAAIALIVSRVVGKARENAVEFSFPASVAKSKRAASPEPSHADRLDWIVLAGYIACGLIVTAYVFLASIGNPETFYSRWDNQIHVGIIRSFLDSNTWSSLVTSSYLTTPEYAMPYMDEPSFYPAVLHAVMAFACSATGASVSCSMNAVNAMFAAVVIPVSLFAFIKAAFPGNLPTLAAGVVAASACAVFPWWLFVAGPLYPNFAACAYVPASAGCAIAMLEQGVARRKLPSVAALAICSLASLGLTQPNAVFFLFVILACYGTSFIYRFAKRARLERGRHAAPHGKSGGLDLRAVGAAALFVAAVIVFWTICLHVPLLKDVVEYEVETHEDVLRVLITLAGMFAVQPLFALAALAGIIICCKRRNFWVLAPAGFMAVAYLAASLCPDTLGRFLAGFWYTDTRRLGPCLGLMLTPLAAFGLGTALNAMVARLSARASRKKLALGVASALGAAFFALNLFPSFAVDVMGTTYRTGFGTFMEEIYQGYNPEVEHVYAQKEIDFVNEVRDAIGTDPLILNQPQDGSAFSYGVNGVNAFYRSFAVGSQTDDSIVLREEINRYAEDDRVKEAVKNTGVEYVLLLDYQVPLEEGTWFARYKNPDTWKGLNALTDETPGFSTVLAEDDMRLYKIEGAGAQN